MLHATITRLKSLLRRGSEPGGASLPLAFLIISIGMGALAWRSHVLSVRMEEGARTIAIQYAGYAAEITARRIDAVTRTEVARLADEWQQIERRDGAPTSASLRSWIARYDWILSAIYVPDYDPADSVFATDPASPTPPTGVTREFFTSSGTVRYTYDPAQLLRAKSVQAAVRQQPLARRGGAGELTEPAEITLVRDTQPGLTELDGGFAFTTRLSEPLGSFGICAFVRTEWVGGSALQNQRVVSLWVSLAAMLLTVGGGFLAVRSIRKEAETMRLRGALIANVSHELRTPLSMIRLGAETLKRGRLTEREQSEIQDQVLREVLLLSHLVENVLDVARIQNQSTKALAFTPVEPAELIRNLIATYGSWIASKGFTCTLDLDDAIDEQMWDRDAVSRAVLNLIDNAIKYSADERAIDVVLRATDEHVIIEVRDRGVGIDAKDAERIFDPYYRARFSDTITRRGAGLGLTLVQQIINSHGGRVEVESKPGAGSTFRLLFPASLSRELMEAVPGEAF